MTTDIEKKTTEIELLSTCDIETADHGRVEVTEEHLDQMALNFNNNIRGIKEDGKPTLAINFVHDKKDLKLEGAAGWIQGVRRQDNKLLAIVDWTKKGFQALKDKTFKFPSAEFTLKNVTNKWEKKTSKGASLLGAALTNTPQDKSVSTIKAFSENPVDISTLTIEKEKLMEEFNVDNALQSFDKMADSDIAKLPKDKINALLNKITANHKFEDYSEGIINLMKKGLNVEEQAVAFSEEKNTNGKLQARVELLEQAANLKEKEVQFSELVRLQKAVPAQKDAYIEGDMIKFAENATAHALPTSEAGTSATGNISNLSSKQEANMEILSKVKELQTAKTIDFMEARRQILKNNPDLAQALKG